MGEMVEFPSNGSSARGYLATASGGRGPGVLVIQEWWGLVPQIKRVCDRLAAEGFTALAPDLYHGEIAEHDERDRAGQLAGALPPDRAARDMGGAIEHLLSLDSVQGDRVGVIGFCMGGMLSWLIGAARSQQVGALVPFYGAPLGDAKPDWSKISAPVQGHFAADDAFFPVEGVRELEGLLRGMGKDITFHYYPGTGHAFANEDNALGTYDPEAAQTAWRRSVEFLHARVG